MTHKLSAVDRAVFRGFAERVIEALEDDTDNELTKGLNLLRPDKNGPAKDSRPPRASYARQEMSRDLVDHVVSKSAT